jgi:hypothetical protein
LRGRQSAYTGADDGDPEISGSPRHGSFPGKHDVTERSTVAFSERQGIKRITPTRLTCKRTIQPQPDPLGPYIRLLVILGAPERARANAQSRVQNLDQPDHEILQPEN